MAEDRRIALAALAVTAIIGVTSPLIASMHDSSRLRSEQAQADRTELRGVLDRAASSLDQARVRFHESWAAMRLGRSVSFESRASDFNRQLTVLGQSYNRVAIRLGPGSRAAQRMKLARDAARRVVSELLRERSRSNARSVVGRVRGRFDALQARTNEFVSAASRVAGSTLE